MSREDQAKLASSANNTRELRHLRAQERIAANLGRIADVLALWYAKQYDECDPFGKIAELAVIAPPEVEIKEKTSDGT